jgi:hypothetical protein
VKKLLLLGLFIGLAGCSSAASEVVSPTATAPAPAAGEIVAEKDTSTPVPSDVEGPVPSDVEGPVPSDAEGADQNTDEASVHQEVEGSGSADETMNHAELLNALLFRTSTRAEGQAILDDIAASKDTRFVAGLIDVLRYQQGLTPEIGQTLNALTGQDLEPFWPDWVEWAGAHPEIESFDDYSAWKGNLFSQIDPNFLRFVNGDMKVDPASRVEEIVWGGVRVDGIPALDNPKMIDPQDADYLIPNERVFGVSINGDTRAYPARFLDWHEMFNDIVGGEPVSLAY